MGAPEGGAPSNPHAPERQQAGKARAVAQEDVLVSGLIDADDKPMRAVFGHQIIKFLIPVAEWRKSELRNSRFPMGGTLGLTTFSGHTAVPTAVGLGASRTCAGLKVS